VLVVGGGDMVAKYVEYARKQGNRVTLSYLGAGNTANLKALRKLFRGKTDRSVY
jgi:uridylate kinase